MYRKQECIAMLLAGGQGSRLYAMTEKTAKPAVQFGGKYRIIDFTLSNCMNSGIYTIGVLTQYQPLELNEYVGSGEVWDLDRTNGGVRVLPPYQRKKNADWYKGTANAIYQNMRFIEQYDPTYVLILSADHIYKMDYSRMLAFHKERGAVCTIAVIDVPLEEANRFGIMMTDKNDRIVSFEEKPEHPKSTQASMGIYIFDRHLLKEYLRRDDHDPLSDKDFGKNVIPAMLADGHPVYAYRFNGYWKDVGTVQSLWEANMDLLGVSPRFDLNDPDWRIYTRNNAEPPLLLGEHAVVHNSLIAEGCEIYGTVENSVLSGDVRIAEGTCVRDSVVMPHVTLESDTMVQSCIIDNGVIVGKNVNIGSTDGITVVGRGIRLEDELTIPGGVIVNTQWLKENTIKKGDGQR